MSAPPAKAMKRYYPSYLLFFKVDFDDAKIKAVRTPIVPFFTTIFSRKAVLL